MEERPRIKIELTITDKVFEVLGWFAVLAIWIITIASYSGLPNTIPIHYNGAGQVDGFGEKESILILPLMATITFVVLTILNKFPHIFNYLNKITKENALEQYTNGTRMIRYLKFVIVIVFGLIEFKIIQNATEHTSGLGVWFLPLTLGLIFIPMIYFMVKQFKTKQ